MCGIVAALTKKDENVNQVIANQYDAQRTRGHEGFGSINIQKDRSYEIKRSTGEVKSLVDLHFTVAPSIIFHHRNPTSTGNFQDQTHPILVSNDCLSADYLVVHNGIISNADEVKKKHEADGFKYTTEYVNTHEVTKFNDSEAFAIDIARHIDGDKGDIEAYGSVAFIALKINKKTKKADTMYFGRNTNPLNMIHTDEYIGLSSEGAGDPIPEHTLHIAKLSGKTFVITTKELNLLAYKKVETTDKTKALGFHRKGTNNDTFHAHQHANHHKAPKQITGFDTTADDYSYAGYYNGRDNYRQSDLELADEEIERVNDEVKKAVETAVEDWLRELADPDDIATVDLQDVMPTIAKELRKALTYAEYLWHDQFAQIEDVSEVNSNGTPLDE